VKEFEWEPIPGLPERLPEGERILWQGAPRWTALARRAFHVRKVAVYFALLIVLVLIMEMTIGGDSAGSSLGAGWPIVLAIAAIGLLELLAWTMSRATVYTITNRRVVMRFGVAIPMTINLPFRRIASAALKEYPDGTGEIPLTLTGSERTSYLVLWPHARPWYFSPAQPMLRTVPDAARVARILADALSEASSAKEDGAAAPNDADGGSRAGPVRSVAVALPSV
jgi:hypothetical protein